ncbi:MAG: Hsp20/alpha crystallin family protein [Burkholderiales bacterium]|nr:Hsp20/alpha crystallin family protein [Burkholderiales bacterium]
MTALTRTDRMFDDLFPEIFRRFARMPAPIEGPADIRVDVKEDDKGFEVRAEVPGAKKEDIRVAIDGNVVSISTEVKQEKEEKGDKGPGGRRTLVRELYYGSCARSFTLPHEVDAKASTAKLDNGVLTLRLPRATESASRSLKIE